MKNKPLVIGVTGGIASGKSEVCRLFGELGVPPEGIISADELARKLMETQAPLKKKLQSAFGHAIYRPDGTLDRKHLAAIVFSDPVLTRRINAIVHPRVIAELRKRIAGMTTRSDLPFLLVEAALLYESGADALMDYTIVVDADESIRTARALKQRGIPRAEFTRRVNAQSSPKGKTDKADFVIVNNGDRRSLATKVRLLYGLLMSLEGPSG